MLKFLIDEKTDTNVIERMIEIPVTDNPERKLVALHSLDGSEPVNVGWLESDGSYTAQPGYRFVIEADGEPTHEAPNPDEIAADARRGRRRRS